MITKIGHRGAMGHAPENTIASFKKAIELNVDMTELDVFVCKTGELVVIRDEKVDRTTNGQGYVIDKTLDELKSLDAGDGQKIPTLEEVLDVIDRQVKVIIELKGVGSPKLVHEVIEDYVKNKGWQYDDFFIASFNHHYLKEFNELNPNVNIGALLMGMPIDFAEFAQKVNAYSVNLSSEYVNQAFVDDAHNRGLKVYVWVVNESDEIEKMKELGVDGIVSNFPDRL